MVFFTFQTKYSLFHFRKVDSNKFLSFIFEKEKKMISNNKNESIWNVGKSYAQNSQRAINTSILFLDYENCESLKIEWIWFFFWIAMNSHITINALESWIWKICQKNTLTSLPEIGSDLNFDHIQSYRRIIMILAFLFLELLVF